MEKTHNPPTEIVDALCRLRAVFMHYGMQPPLAIAFHREDAVKFMGMIGPLNEFVRSRSHDKPDGRVADLLGVGFYATELPETLANPIPVQ